jgi:hypothetical protein
MAEAPAIDGKPGAIGGRFKRLEQGRQAGPSHVKSGIGSRGGARCRGARTDHQNQSGGGKAACMTPRLSSDRCGSHVTPRDFAAGLLLDRAHFVTGYTESSFSVSPKNSYRLWMRPGMGNGNNAKRLTAASGGEE